MNINVFILQGPVVQRPDSAIHRIVIFSSFVKSVVDWYNSYLNFSIYKLNVFYTSCVVYIRSFTVFQAFYNLRLKKSLSGG